MPRPRTPIGTFGEIYYEKAPGGRFRAFARFRDHDGTVSKVDQFIKTLASTKSYSTAKQARTMLSLAFGLAVRYDAIPRNPVRDTVRLQKPPRKPRRSRSSRST